MKIAIIGGSGLIGKHLAKSYSDHIVYIVSRKNSLPRDLANLSHVKLISSDHPKAADLEGIDVIINLAGESILAGRWTEETKKRIRSSRVDKTKQLIDDLSELKTKPKLFIQGSAIGYYGMYDSGKPVFNETEKAGSDYLAKLCLDWEKEGSRANEIGIPTATIRIGIVLAKEGGALAQMLPPFKMFVGGPLGSGKQFMSWIHINDLVSAIRFIIENQQTGIFNLTAPNPCSNYEFSKTLGKVISRPSLLNVPPLAVTMLYGEGAEVILKGQNVLPEKLNALKFQFQFSNLETALENLLK
ncbi:MAG TPA: TIGR01777 family oxidoreductase [Leptospiraceae bacterium]|nr:TIGR01777 family oxidoreductase [Leptospiraceae bacterium]HMX30986.1 TIGR01777 family oxidoreductase [Leptospiraceae bacterium]HMY32195.1 TIGR01777 family oxidoreductase [Leptospiraceae bacterium]HMZ63804.1 TIGR01777 family oxidoreductase [Leptospiraceae bacterium]HNA06766.1 TIGR01777 family oxidoreductase [Leptospiraceae bacterium]